MRIIGLIICTALILLPSCWSKKEGGRTDTMTSGMASIVVDECFAPIVQEQVDVFNALNPDALILPVYTGENEAFDLFMKDSMRIMVVARELTAAEKQKIQERKPPLSTQTLAVDGIAIIVNKNNKDTLISVANLKKIMTGEIRSWKELNPESPLGDIAVSFDSPNSSTVKYIRDSITHGTLGDNLKARAADSTKSVDLAERTPNQQVIDYVTSNPNAMGIIGVNWISNPSDSTSLSFVNNITVMSVSREDVATAKNSRKPFAGYIALREYPLVRNVFIIMSDFRGGLPSGFLRFATSENGQRIVLRAGLVPGSMPTRLVKINETLD